MKNFKVLLSALVLLFAFSQCKKTTVTVEENITTVKLNFLNKGVASSATFKDSDGPGGNNPTIDTIYLTSEQQIDCSVEILDESQTPIVNLTSEILQESNAHLFLYKIQVDNLQVVYNDTDDLGKNFGLKTLWKTGNITDLKIGALTVILRHEPTNKNDLANPGGETDVEVTFPVKFN
jgi:hypothetical protein